MLVELISTHQCSIVFFLDEGLDLRTSFIDTEVQVAEKDLNVVILDLIALILSASISTVSFIHDVSQLLVSLFDVSRVGARRQVAIQEAKRGVLEAESDSYGALCSSSVVHDGFHFGHGYVKDARLDLSLGNQENVESVLISLTDELVLGLACVRVKRDHYVILHKS